MDALAFATVVGLLSEFVSHRRATEVANFDEFVSWLSERRHEDVVSLLQTATGAAVGTKALLNETREVLLNRLSALDTALVQYAGAVDGFAALACAIAPKATLSNQAVSILRQINE